MAFSFTAMAFFTLSAAAQSLNFSSYQLINGGDGQKGAEYRFANVLTDANGHAMADCIVRIDDLSAGVLLKSIDNAANNDAAFQPVVEHMNTIGPSWIEFSFSFVSPSESRSMQDMFEMPLLAASIYGLNGFEKAQEFAECDLGSNSQIVYETEINNLMVTRIGNAFRAENKWGVQTAREATKQTNEKFSLLNQQVKGFKVKFGVNRKAQTWAGVSTYNLALSESAPSLNALNNTLNEASGTTMLNNYVSDDKAPVKKGSVTATSRNTIPSEQMSQVEMQVSSKMVAERVSLHLPQGWAGKEVVFELYNDNGDIIQKVIEHKSIAVEILDMKPLAAGSYVIMASCQKEFAVQYVIHTQQL
jgi:hypothetical protein